MSSDPHVTIALRLHSKFSGTAVISDDGDFLFEKLFFPEDPYKNLLRQISNITTTLLAKYGAQGRLGLCITYSA